MSPPKPSLDDLKIARQPPSKPGPLRLIIAAILILLLIGGFFWWRSRAGTIEVQTAVAHEITSNNGDRTVLNASGYVTARRAATASSKVTGKVMEVLIEEGMRVKEGQVLARLDDTNVKANLNVAKAQLESSKKSVGET